MSVQSQVYDIQYQAKRKSIISKEHKSYSTSALIVKRLILKKLRFHCNILVCFKVIVSSIKANTFGSSHLNDDGTLKWKEKMDKCSLKPIEEAIDLKSVKGDYYLAYALFCLKNPAQE